MNNCLSSKKKPLDMAEEYMKYANYFMTGTMMVAKNKI